MSIPKKNTSTPISQDEFPLTRKNYILLAIGALLILIGFGLMATEGFIDATQFSLSLYVSPLLIVGGFIWIIYAILAKDSKKGTDIPS
jgi:hypothetical protein